MYPVTEEVPFGVEEGYSEYELSTLENLAEESVELLDGKVYEFVHVLSNYIMSLDNHDSLADPLRDAYISAKTKAASAAEQYKKYVIFTPHPVPRRSEYVSNMFSIAKFVRDGRHSQSCGGREEGGRRIASIGI